MRTLYAFGLGLLGGISALHPAQAATQAPQVWTTNVVAGEFPTQQAALAAVHALGGVYVMAEQVESVVPTTTGTTYIYGAMPRPPEVGPWRDYTIQWALSNPHASEAEAIASVLAKSEENAPGCGGASVVPKGDWYAVHYYSNSGLTDQEGRFYDNTYPILPGCVLQQVQIQAVRYRDVACTAGLTWDSTLKACANKDIARLTSRPAPCSGCDLRHNPVNVSTGDKYQAETDISLPWITFTRHYHSALPMPSAHLGPGWTHEYNVRIYPGSTSSGGMLRPSGEMLAFQSSEPNDGSEWRYGYSALGYRVQTPTQVMSFYQNKLSRLDSISGDNLDLSYDVHKRLSRITHGSGRYLELLYETEPHPTVSRLIAIHSDGVQLVGYAYDAAGRLVSAVSADGTSREYHYENPTYPNHLTGISNEAQVRSATFAYDGDGLATLSQHANGLNSGSFTYRTDGATEYTDANGRTQTFQFDAAGAYRKIGSISGPEGVETTSYTTHLQLRPLKHVDRRGVITTYAYKDDYDAALGGNFRLTTRNQAVGTAQARTDYTWRNRTRGAVLRTRNSLSESNYLRNGRGQVVSVATHDRATGATRTTTTSYCEQEEVDTAGSTCPLLGLTRSVDGPRDDISDVTSYHYYPSDDPGCAISPTQCAYRKGDLWRTSNALGHFTEILRYDGAGRVLSVKDANGITSDMEYHPRGWLTARTMRGLDDASEADDRITRIEYEPTGLVRKTTLPDGSYTSFTYDAAHRLTDIVDAEGNRIHYTLDNAGNRIKEDTIGHNGTAMRTLSRVYNQLGQLQTAADADYSPTDFTYDANGNTDTITDAYGRTSDNSYDPLNRLTQTIQDLGGIDATTTFQYDAQDNLTAVMDPKSLTTRYAYNGLGDLTTLDSPDTGTTTYTYDSAGNRKTQTDARGELATYDYDALNRLTSIGYATPALDVTYTYDLANAVCDPEERFATGRLSALTDASGTTHYCYDRFGQLTRKVQTTNGTVLTLRYAYTKAGQLSGITYPDGSFVDYQRDALGRTTTVGVTPPGGARQVLLQEATYYPFGPAAEWVFGNGRLFQRTLNQNYQPGIVQDGFSGGLSLGYEFDAVGNLSTLRNGDQADPPQRMYGYDALNRLIDARDGTTGTVLQGYTYDATGNRQSATSGSTTTGYTTATDSHRLSAVGATSRTYDPAGNTLSIGGTQRQFVYDATGRMSQVLRDNAAVMNYRYNGKGEQVHRHLGTGNIYTMYDEAGHWLGDYDSTGTPIQQAIWLDDLPVGVIAGGHLHYIEADHLGTPRVVIDPQRDVPMWRWELTGEAFGDSAPNQDPDGDASEFVLNMRFPGQRYDAASGLNQNGHREYEPGSGRYSQSDPVGIGGGFATYSYVEANPLINFDPYGLATTTVDACLARHGPGGCGVSTPAGPRLAPGALGGGITASIWCMVTGCIVPGNRPGDMTSLEERHFDRHCNNQDDPCAKLKKAANDAITMARLKMNNMLSDSGRLYGGRGWITHAADLSGRISAINAMISLGEKMGCDMTEQRALAAGLMVPGAPL